MRLDSNTQDNIEQAKKNCVNLLDSFSRVIIEMIVIADASNYRFYRKDRDESERRIYSKLNQQIDSLTIEIQRES